MDQSGERIFNTDINIDGSFSAKIFLRNHNKGKKNMWAEGMVDKNNVYIKVKYGVSGYSSTFCGSKPHVFRLNK